VQTVTKELAERLKLDDADGVVVMDVSTQRGANGRACKPWGRDYPN